LLLLTSIMILWGKEKSWRRRTTIVILGVQSRKLLREGGSEEAPDLGLGLRIENAEKTIVVSEMERESGQLTCFVVEITPPVLWMVRVSRRVLD